MHDEQDPALMPGGPTEPMAGAADEQGSVEAPAEDSAVSELDVELPFEGADLTAPAPPAVEDAGTVEPIAGPNDSTGPNDTIGPNDSTGPNDTTAAEPVGDAGAAGEGVATDDPEEATRRKLALLAEAEAIVATPDKNESGHAPDDRLLTERMRAVENVWRRVGAAGDREIELRTRLQELRQAYAAARSRRAEARAVDRARAAETKRALLVQAFALAQQVDPSIAMPTAPSPPTPRPPVRRRPSPAMLARRPSAETPSESAATTEGSAEPPPDPPHATEAAAESPADAAGSSTVALEPEGVEA